MGNKKELKIGDVDIVPLLAPEGFLEMCKTLYFEGRKSGLLNAVAYALACEIEVPDWARKELIRACFFNKPKSWDDVFGTPFPKGAKVASLQKLNRIKSKVFCRVRELNAQGRSIGDELFEQVGKEFGISTQTVRDTIYYSGNMQLAAALHDWFLSGSAEPNTFRAISKFHKASKESQ